MREADVAVLIKTIAREEVCRKCIASIEEHLKSFAYRIYLADDSKTISSKQASFYDSLTKEGHAVIRLPYDVGVSAGRNAGLDALENERFVLLLDDDVQMTSRTDLTVPAALLDAFPHVMICGAKPPESAYQYQLRLLLGRGGILYRIAVPEHGEEWRLLEVEGREPIHWLPADTVDNAFLAKTELFKHVRWDPKLKVTEHMDFFIMVKNKMVPDAVVFSSEFVFIFPKGAKTPELQKLRGRGRFFSPYVWEKHGFRAMLKGYPCSRAKVDTELKKGELRVLQKEWIEGRLA